MSWLNWARRLRSLGVLGMNHRNTRLIQALNPRRRFPLVDSKQLMHRLCRQIGVPTPELYGVVSTQGALRSLPDLLGPRSDFVVKPDRGAGGRGILVITGREGQEFVRHNGRRLSLAELRQHVSSILSGLHSLGGDSDQALVQQRVTLDPHFARISYQGIGDVRVILYRHVPVMAMLRLPTARSGGRANLHQGGIGAGVDLDTGRTCHAVQGSRVVSRHPDTGASVVGFRVPHWSAVLSMARAVSRAVGLGYLGVDIVLDGARGPLLLEANARPGLAIQIANGRGLLPRLQAVDAALATPEAEPQPAAAASPVPVLLPAD
jgi:alpha-L-glutamate ligase-like protein